MRRRRWPIAIVVAVAVAAGGWYAWDEWPERVSAEIGERYFRHRDFGSPDETGIPYPLAWALLDLYPDDFGHDRDDFCEKFGVYTDPDDPDGLPVGFVLRRDRASGIDFLMTNCSLCHQAVVDGRKIPGLGNRQLKLNALNGAILRVAGRDDFTVEKVLPAAEAVAKRRGLAWGWLAEKSLRSGIATLRRSAESDRNEAWGGMRGIVAGPGRTTPMEFAKVASRVAVAPPYGFAKYPALWTFPGRENFGHDGSLKGDMAIAVAAFEFNKGMSAHDILHHRERWSSVREFMKTLTPPPFPRPTDAALVARGSMLFIDNCVRCHAELGPSKEMVVPLDEIATDPDRLNSVTAELIAARGQGELAKWVRMEQPVGYVVPSLVGVWCRAPYLHNGSIPTLFDLLQTEAERPVTFPVGEGVDYDMERVGLPYIGDLNAADGRSGKPTHPRQSIFDTLDPGNGNRGHTFGSTLPEADKAALLEFLKSL